MELGGHNREISCTFHATSIQIPTGGKVYCFASKKEHYGVNKKKDFLPPLETAEPMRGCHDSDNK